MNEALVDYDPLPFRAPSGVRFMNIDARSGTLPGPNSQVIREAFRRGSEPGFEDSFGDDLDSIFGNGNSGEVSTGVGDIFDGNGDDPVQPGQITPPAQTGPEDFDGEVY